MDDQRKTRLEWMHGEFDDARRRRLVKPSEQPAESATNADVHPVVPATPSDPAVTPRRRNDHPTAK